MATQLPEPISFTSPMWLWSGGKASWHFITVPKEASDQLKFFAPDVGRGFGSIPVRVRIGETVWNTSVFPSKESGCYILPVKAAVRKAESIAEGDEVAVAFI